MNSTLELSGTNSYESARAISFAWKDVFVLLIPVLAASFFFYIRYNKGFLIFNLDSQRLFIKNFVAFGPVIFLGSYVCLVKSRKLHNTLVVLLATPILFVTKLYSLAYLFCYIVFALSLIAGIIVFRKYYLFIFLFSSSVASLMIYLLPEVYSLISFFGNYQLTSQYFGQEQTGLLLRDFLFLGSWMLFDISKNNVKINFSELLSYAFCPIFLIGRLPISLREFSSRQISNRDFSTKLASLSRGWFVLFKGFVLHILFNYFSLGDTFEIYAKLNIMAGCVIILGYDIRVPFDNILESRGLIDFFRRWNIYWREWLVQFVFIPALNVTKSLYASILVTFAISGVIGSYIVKYSFGDHIDAFRIIVWTLFGVLVCVFAYFHLKNPKVYKKNQIARSGIYKYLYRFVTLTFVILVLKSYLLFSWLLEKYFQA